MKNQKNTKNKIELVFKKWAKLVNPKIKQILDISLDKKTKSLVNYQIETGGKRLRPALTIACCLACGGNIEDALYPAAGLEILHNCTLIYDDIVDDSNLRRGKPTVWSKFGRSIAECIGMDYAVSMFQAANKSNHPIELSEIFAKTLKTVEDGEILDLLFEQAGKNDEKYIIENRYRRVTEKDYLKMVGKKTASLLSACCEVGALSAGKKEAEIEALKQYGFNLGIAFQIKDDILDIFGNQKEFGKKIGKDIEERKLGNIVICYGLQEFSKKEKEFFLAILVKDKITCKDIEKALKLVNKTKAKEKAFLLGEKYVRRAKENLKMFPQGKWSNFLENIADFVMYRGN